MYRPLTPRRLIYCTMPLISMPSDAWPKISSHPIELRWVYPRGLANPSSIFVSPTFHLWKGWLPMFENPGVRCSEVVVNDVRKRWCANAICDGCKCHLQWSKMPSAMFANGICQPPAPNNDNPLSRTTATTTSAQRQPPFPNNVFGLGISDMPKHGVAKHGGDELHSFTDNLPNAIWITGKCD